MNYEHLSNEQHPLYYRWRNMRRRCMEEPSYISKGITVCERWGRFKDFLEDMGMPPSSKCTLDRIDPRQGYHPGNVRWADPLQQRENQAQSLKYVMYQGERTPLRRLCNKLGLKYATVASRLKRGWSEEEAMSGKRINVKAASQAFTSKQMAEVPMLRFFEYAHLPEKLQPISKQIATTAKKMVKDLPPGSERTAGLRKLLEAKDCFVRAAL